MASEETWETAFGLVTASIEGDEETSSELMYRYVQPTIIGGSIDPAEFIPRVLQLIGVLTASLGCAVAVTSTRNGHDPVTTWRATMLSAAQHGIINKLASDNPAETADAIRWIVTEWMQIPGGTP